MWNWIVDYILFGWLWRKKDKYKHYTLKIRILRIDGVPFEGDEDMAVINDIQEIDLAVVCENQRGNISQVYGTPNWSTTTPEIFDLVPAADGLSCVGKAVGGLGDGIIIVEAFVDQEQTQVRTDTITIPVAASPGETVRIVEGAIRIQTEFNV